MAWVSAEIMDIVRENPTISMYDLRLAVTKNYAETTLRQQLGRALDRLGLKEPKGDTVSKNKNKNKGKGKDKPKRDPIADAINYQESLARLNNIPRTAFVPHEAASTMANGAKRHVNLMTAEEDQVSQEVINAESWVAWLRHLGEIPKTYEIDFVTWTKQRPKHALFRKKKLLKRWEELQMAYLILEEAMKKAKAGLDEIVEQPTEST